MVTKELSFDFQLWGHERRLKAGMCHHCNRGVGFVPIDDGASGFSVKLQDPESYDEYQHVFLAGRCPMPDCQRATILYVEHFRPSFGDSQIERTEVIFPRSTGREPLPDEVPDHLRRLYNEAGRVESLSPNSVGFLARRILEQALRDKTGEHKKMLATLLKDFEGEFDGVSSDLTEIVREFGNIACHAGRDENGRWVEVTPLDAAFCLFATRRLLDFLYVQEARDKAMLERVRAKKAGKALDTPNVIAVAPPAPEPFGAPAGTDEGSGQPLRRS